jgi:hypothetical protein
MSKKTPIELFIYGDISKSDLLELISDISPYNTLGLTEDEYALYQRIGELAIDDIVKARMLKAQIIDKAKIFFREEIAKSHIQNIEKLTLKSFNLNPFLDKYKANILSGNASALSIAKALVYPRVLGSSINTTFGNKLQKFCSTILEGYASTTTGIDIEFIDLVDGRRKYCQIKSGPNTINKDDVKTIEDHFQSIKNLARTNNLNIGINDLVVGVFYGEPNELSGHYKNIQKNYPVYIGKEFWHRLTGDDNFYSLITSAMGDVASEFDGSSLINRVINELAKEIEKTLED